MSLKAEKPAFPVEAAGEPAEGASGGEHAVTGDEHGDGIGATGLAYGAGGSTRERTHHTISRILQETSLVPAAHLTGVKSASAVTGAPSLVRYVQLLLPGMRAAG